MSLELKFFIFQLLIIIPFILGSYLKNIFQDLTVLAKKIIKVNLIIIEPLVVLWSIWGIKLSYDLIFLPISGLAFAVLGYLLGIISLNFLKLAEKSKKTYLISSSLANHGFSMGGFICYLFLGETGLGLSVIFITYFLPYIFLFIFPYAQGALHSDQASLEKKFIRTLKNIFINPQNMPLYMVFLGFIFYFFDIKRPDIFFPADILLMISISLYYFILGTNFSFSNLFYLKMPHYTLAIIKFIMIPALIYFILYFIDINTSIKSVLIIQSCMPVAIYSVVSSILFDLDSKFASSLFVINTIFFIVFVLPLLFLLYSNNFLF